MANKDLLIKEIPDFVDSFKVTASIDEVHPNDRAENVPHYVIKDNLHLVGACSDGRDSFHKSFPDGFDIATVTREQIEKAYDDFYLDFSFFSPATSNENHVKVNDLWNETYHMPYHMRWWVLCSAHQRGEINLVPSLLEVFPIYGIDECMPEIKEETAEA
jgi:hypothetical protein